MNGRLAKHDGSLALVLDPETVDALQLSEGAEMRVRVEAGLLIASPAARPISPGELDAAIKWSHEKYGAMFKRLAD